MKRRIITTDVTEEEEKIESTLRPKSLVEYIGQTKVKRNLQVFIEAAKKRHEPLDHVLLYGPPGLGKTTLACIVAEEMGVNIKITSGPAIEKPGELAAILNNLSENDVLFIDASGEGNFEKGKNQNILRDCDIEKIVQTYEARAEIEKYSHKATKAEIIENDYNLNIPRYVDTFEEEELIDIDQIKQNIADIEKELAGVQKQMAKYLKDLGL